MKPFSGIVTLVGFVAVIAIGAFSDAAAITVTDAKVAGGKLVVTGKTTAAGQQVKLDNLFTVTSNGSKAFSFGIKNYLPSDCVVKLTAPGNQVANAVVAFCGSAGVRPRGAWAGGASYLMNDLVVHQQSAWRAKVASVGKQPGATSQWEKFAAKGLAGAKGPKGLQGLQGPQGNAGQVGDPGGLGEDGAIGPTGDQGAQGVSNIVETINLTGEGNLTMPAIAAYKFVKVNQVTVGAGQRLTASASVPAKASATDSIQYAFCYRANGSSSDPIPFNGLNSYLAADVGTTFATLSAGATMVPGAGTYDVGLCMAITGGLPLALDWVSGWVQVTDF